MQRYQGSCLCGQVHYQIEAELTGFVLCHCQHCQKGTGSAHAANAFANQGTLTWLKGEDLVTHFQLEKSCHQRSFCRQCGSPMPNVQAQTGLLMLPVGSLDQSFDQAPMAHIFDRSRAAWEQNLEQVPRFDTLPPMD